MGLEQLNVDVLAIDKSTIEPFPSFSVIVVFSVSSVIKVIFFSGEPFTSFLRFKKELLA